ncbi:MAG: hypothetical protein A2Z11_00505 [Candidatus Woykebacteria bacterium RBG_16_43_9]|uniref:Fido domain-containing protein n=1 Tax=Candidatus Woykebacteria bacterium RBG_16_43_9 TaxID=1802596 RepID=A0A1G1WEY2_9BACT|nr:MAG: hypothetical protein A2Z11_00505 [Candidatus Woykebacteria bacterium RBG_16_43_9]
MNEIGNHEISDGLESRVGLTETDKELILKQCENQKATSTEEVSAFTDAYREAKKFAFTATLSQLSEEEVLSLVKDLAELTVPQTKGQYRTVPVTFRSGERGIDPALIERAMSSWAQAFAANQLSALEAYEEFEKIHPFVDGNGRVGDLVWKIATVKESGKWPEELPPDVFGGSND